MVITRVTGILQSIFGNGSPTGATPATGGMLSNLPIPTNLPVPCDLPIPSFIPFAKSCWHGSEVAPGFVIIIGRWSRSPAGVRARATLMWFSIEARKGIMHSQSARAPVVLLMLFSLLGVLAPVARGRRQNVTREVSAAVQATDLPLLTPQAPRHWSRRWRRPRASILAGHVNVRY